MMEFTGSICGIYDAASHSGDAGKLDFVSRPKLACKEVWTHPAMQQPIVWIRHP